MQKEIYTKIQKLKNYRFKSFSIIDFIPFEYTKQAMKFSCWFNILKRHWTTMKYRIRPRETVGSDEKYLSTTRFGFGPGVKITVNVFSFFSFFFLFLEDRRGFSFSRRPIELTRRK